MVFESKGFTETIFDSKGLARKIRQTKELVGDAAGHSRGSCPEVFKERSAAGCTGAERAWPSDQIAGTQPLTFSMAVWVGKMGHKREVYIPGGMMRLGRIGWVWGVDRVGG